MDFDLIIRGGEVVDPGSGLLGAAGRRDPRRRDRRGGPDLPGRGGRRDARRRGQIVTPGLIDLHTHVYWGATYWGIEPDPIAARTGVTTWVDAGTAGGYGFPGFRRYVVEASEARVLALLNVSSIGLTAPTYELANLDYSELDLARQIVDANRDVIVGIKVRIDPDTTRGIGIEPLRLARELADQVGLPLMVHVGKAPPALDEIVALLRPGDILTHCFTGHDEPHPGAGRATRTSSAGPGTPDSSSTSATGPAASATRSPSAMLAQGCPPDVISTDIHQLSVQGPMFDLPTTLSKFLNLGMSLPDAIERATSRPARAMRRPELASLKPGSPADVAVFASRRALHLPRHLHDGAAERSAWSTLRLSAPASGWRRARAAARALGRAARASAREVGHGATIRVQLSRATRRTEGTSVRRLRRGR